MANWKPIKTAPKNGQQFLAVRKLMEAPFYSMNVIAYIQAEGLWLVNLDLWENDDFLRIFTHWTELPEHPKPN